MTLVIREYQHSPNDWRRFCQALEGLQEYLVGKDQLGLLKLEPGYAEQQVHEARIVTSKRNGAIFMAEVDGEFAGVITGYMVPEEAVNPHGAVYTRFGIISDVFVVQGHRRKGIGSQLMQTLEEHLRAKGCQAVCVNVKAFNTNALAFYERFGYNPMDIRLVKVV